MKLKYWILLLFLPVLLVFSDEQEIVELRMQEYSIFSILAPHVDGWYPNGAYLQKLINKYNITKVFEIGVWLGMSSMDIAQKLPPHGKLFAIDHFLGSTEHQPGAWAYSPYLPCLYQQFLSNVYHAGLCSKIIPIRMNSLDASKYLSSIQPGLIYIDAGHEFDDVSSDLSAWYPYIKDTNGVLCGDDW